MMAFAICLFISLTGIIKTTSALPEESKRGLAEELSSVVGNLETLSNGIEIERKARDLSGVLSSAFDILKNVSGVIFAIAAGMGSQGSIGFTATIQGGPQNISRYGVLPFSNMVDSHGGGLNTSDGKFYCSQSGMYIFSSSIALEETGCLFDFKKNNVTIAHMYKGGYTGLGTSSATLVLRLVNGDSVWVQSNGTCQYAVVGTLGTIFSGVFVSV